MVGIIAKGVDMWIENCDGNWLNMDQAKKLEIDDRRSLDLPSRIKIPVTTNDDYWDETIIFWRERSCSEETRKHIGLMAQYRTQHCGVQRSPETL